MPTFKQIVKSVGAILLNHPIGQVPSIKAFWKNCEFKIMNEQGQGHAALEPYENAILLYPSLETLPQAQAEAEILRQFGMYLVRQGRAAAEKRWAKKYSYPTEEQIEAVQRKLDDPTLRQNVQSYEALMNTFKGAVDRLICLNLTNALLANGVAFRNSLGVKLKEWGPTSEYAKLEKPHSLIPLVSAYAPKEVVDDYGAAFAELVLNKMMAVKESTTRKAFEEMIRYIAKMHDLREQ